jgi:predicted short-subunit dehydrogenase-like oxidoreductase (DUF2520 family)
MKRQLPVGLVVEGNSTNSVVLRLPHLGEELGPIKSTGLRVARRLSNFLHAGYPVSTYQQLQKSRLILVRAPDAAVPRIVSDLRASQLDLKAISFVFCETWLMTDSFAQLSQVGASIATLVAVPSTRHQWFILDGDTSAVRQARRLLQQSDARALEIRPGTKALYFGAELLARAIPIPLFAAAQYALREAGISGNHLYTVLEDLCLRMYKDFSKGPRVSWGGPLNDCSPDLANAHMDALYRNHPQLAQFISEELASAKRTSEISGNAGRWL